MDSEYGDIARIMYPADSYKYVLQMIIYKFSKRERLFVHYGLLAVQLPRNFQLIYQNA